MNVLRAVFYLCVLMVLSACNAPQPGEKVSRLNKPPEIFPDYIGVMVPPNIAPLNFRIEEDSVEHIKVVVEGKNNQRLNLSSSGPVQFPLRQWKDILGQTKGDTLHVTITVQKGDKWLQYKPFSIYVSPDPIDYGLTYRLIAPGYEVYSKMGLYQRKLSGFSERPVLENTLIQGSCVNCHSFRETEAEKMSLHIRGKKGGTLLKDGNSMKLLDTKTKKTLSSCVYPYWHPSGEFIAYSVNKTQQAFHSLDAKRIEVFDHASDVVILDRHRQELFSCDLLKSEDHFETFPVFSPDGKNLYFASSESRDLPDGFKDIQYNLLSIEFDPETRSFGEKVDTLVNARRQDQSISFPRPSYDGKFLMYTKFNYGNFSIWHPEADLWLLDLDTGESKPLEKLNSNRTESYHSWSSNSRWVVFSSRRVNGLYTMPYIAHIDEEGNAGKPFLLPQEDPDHYDETFYSFNVPEFVNNPVDVDLVEFENLVDKNNQQLTFAKKER